MRTIKELVEVIPFGPKNEAMQLFRVIGTVDIDGQGTLHQLGQVDPFIFLDDAIIRGELPTTFKKHPHTGLIAVTYLLEGEMHAWDNIHGVTQDLNRAGGVYCVNAGRGIVHGEAPIEGVRQLRLLQLWYCPDIYQSQLPQASYQLFQPDKIPVYQDEKLWVKVIIGHAFNLSSPVISPWPIQYLHIKIAGGNNVDFTIPDSSWQGFIYVINGKGQFGANQVLGLEKQCLTIGLEKSTTLTVKNSESIPLEFILATGKPHHQSFVKLLGHGGAIVADTESHARDAMKLYEVDPENFGN